MVYPVLISYSTPFPLEPDQLVKRDTPVRVRVFYGTTEIDHVDFDNFDQADTWLRTR